MPRMKQSLIVAIITLFVLGNLFTDTLAESGYPDTLTDPAMVHDDDLGDDFSDSTDDGLGDDFPEDAPDDTDDHFSGGDIEDFTDDRTDDLGDDFRDTLSTGTDVLNDKDAFDENNERFRLSGDVKFSVAENISHKKPVGPETDWRGISRLRTSLLLELDVDLAVSWKAKLSGYGAYDAVYTLRGNDEYTDDVLEENVSELETRKVYVSGQLTGKVDIKIGRQIIVWGKSDNIRLTDIWNPIDMREPGMVDLEDLRLPVCMTKIDYYFGAWSFSAIAVHEKRFNKQPVFGSDFYPLDIPYPPEEELEATFADTEYGFAVGGIFSGWDLAFYYADFFDDMPYLRISENQIPFGLTMRHARIKMGGTAFNIALGNWLIKSEAAYFDAVRFSDTTAFQSGTISIRSVPDSYNRYALLAGAEYSGFTNTMISIESMRTHVLGYDHWTKAADVAEDSFQSALRITRSFMHERLECVLLAMLNGETGQDGRIFRLTGEYEMTDNLLLLIGGVYYDSGDLPAFQNIGDNDRFYCDVKYSF